MSAGDWRERPSVMHPITDAVKPLDIAGFFPTPQPMEIELGCGDGSFLAACLQVHPDRNFVGVERLKGRLKKLDRAARKCDASNLALFRIEASYLLRYLLPAGSFTAIHVYFPDPWPKAKHQKNRLIDAEFPALSRRVLAPQGRVYLRTDDLDYFEQMEEVFAQSPLFERAETPEELKAIRTDFEREFNEQGIPTNYSSWETC